MHAPVWIWILSLLSIALMLLRPFGTREVVWTTAGAVCLVAFRLVPLSVAGRAVRAGTDVYLFLAGMMLLSEMARVHGVFDWLAGRATQLAQGSRMRLFALLYGAGTIVTALMSNDATAVVMTPAVLAAVKRSKAEPLPYLLICALVANAASFVLPISNPANLVFFRTHMPPLLEWLRVFGLASVLSIAATYGCLWWYCRRDLEGAVETPAAVAPLAASGRLMLWGIALISVVLLSVSALDRDLGLPTFLTAVFIAAVVSLRTRSSPLPVVREIAWSVLPLVAGLFVLVAAVESVGALAQLGALFRRLEVWNPYEAALTASFGIGIGANLFNNLPLGLIAGTAVNTIHIGAPVVNAVLVGTDLGPNLSVTGSLATILWLIAIRREGLDVSFWKFLKVGVVVMPPALALASLAVALSAKWSGVR